MSSFNRKSLYLPSIMFVHRAAKEATKTIPIVMISSVDPVAAGYVDSFATRAQYSGLTTIARDLSAKRVELLKKCFPRCRGLAFSGMQRSRTGRCFKEYEAAARAFKLQLRSFEVRGPSPDLAGEVFQLQKRRPCRSAFVVGNPLMAQHGNTSFRTGDKKSLALYRGGRSIRRCRRPGFLRSELSRFIPACRRICRLRS